MEKPTYNQLYEIALKLKKRMDNIKSIQKVKEERHLWWETNPECTQPIHNYPWDSYGGDLACECESCAKRNSFHKRIKELGHKNSGLTNSINKSVEKLNFNELTANKGE